MKAFFSERIRVWTLLICGSALYFFANIQRVAIPGSIFDELQTALQISIDLLQCIQGAGNQRSGLFRRYLIKTIKIFEPGEHLC
ncbi:MAG: hypothetical protein J6W81_00425 [Lentisphaeria bacterium]|nr:hypothetical protein [Lentisphaeria bacterium]